MNGFRQCPAARVRCGRALLTRQEKSLLREFFAPAKTTVRPVTTNIHKKRGKKVLRFSLLASKGN
jgi:hypothetical protein